MSALHATHTVLDDAFGHSPTTVGDVMIDRRPLCWIDQGRPWHRTIGVSRGWQEVLGRAAKVAPTEATVCLSGDSGTGKEVIARYIHRLSPRRRGPFIAINCAALPEQLLESELFGFERGAFTGAHQLKPGQIELAAGGVLFLDEVTEMTPASQSKFLRLLQEREFLRLGGTRPIRANIRVIAATNRDLREAVAKGHFRADLYYRINVVDIVIPPLRERRDDIPLLAASFVSELGDAGGRPAELTPDAMDALVNYDWPGNVRELRNVIERATILCEDGKIVANDLSLRRAEATPVDTTNLDALERQAIERVMHEVRGNKVKASRRLGITRAQLYMRLRKHGLEAVESAARSPGASGYPFRVTDPHPASGNGHPPVPGDVSAGVDR